jgi:uncharacterized membrane protein YphA (DoxX/SURF4 family)
VNRIDVALLILRLVIGGVMIMHGLNHAFGGGRLPGAALVREPRAPARNGAGSDERADSDDPGRTPRTA